MTRFDYIDFAKGYAIFSIVCYHALQRLDLPPLGQQAIVFGGTGVHLFFLLSGFGLGLARPFVSPAAFYQRRLVKIWLPYVLALTLSWLAALAFGLFPDGFEAWLAGAGLYQMFSEKYIEAFGGHFWFISAIIQFYAVYPALVWAREKLGNARFLAAAMALSLAWWLAVSALGKGDLRTWNSFFLQFLWEFALGMVLADRVRKAGPDTPGGQAGLREGIFWNYPWYSYLPAGLLFASVMVLAILKLGETGRVFNDIPALLGYTALSVFVYRAGELYLPPLERFFRWVGGFSFSLYLVHILVLEAWLLGLRWFGLPASAWSILPFFPLALLAGRVFEVLSRKWTGFFGAGQKTEVTIKTEP